MFSEPDSSPPKSCRTQLRCCAAFIVLCRKRAPIRCASSQPVPCAMRATPLHFWNGSAPQPVGRKCRRSEEHTSELQSRGHLVCRLLLEKKKKKQKKINYSHTLYRYRIIHT